MLALMCCLFRLLHPTGLKNQVENTVPTNLPRWDGSSVCSRKGLSEGMLPHVSCVVDHLDSSSGPCRHKVWGRWEVWTKMRGRSKKHSHLEAQPWGNLWSASHCFWKPRAGGTDPGFSPSCYPVSWLLPPALGTHSSISCSTQQNNTLLSGLWE